MSGVNFQRIRGLKRCEGKINARHSSNMAARRAMGATAAGNGAVMDKRPVGVFDSGLGGLTAVRQIMDKMPGEDIIYFGDTGRVPYGTRSREIILKYTRQDIRFLRSFDIKALVVACGTVSTAAIGELENGYDFPVIGVVEPTVKKAAELTRNNRIGLIGTAAAIGSGVYEKKLAPLSPAAQIFSAACPLLVPLVENGRFSRGDKVAEQVVAEYLAPLKQQKVDTLILGCTHYPLLSGIIADYMGPETALIDSGAEAADRLAQTLTEMDLEAGRSFGGTYRYFVSDSVQAFGHYGSMFLNREIIGSVKKVEIEQI